MHPCADCERRRNEDWLVAFRSQFVGNLREQSEPPILADRCRSKIQTLARNLDQVFKSHSSKHKGLLSLSLFVFLIKCLPLALWGDGRDTKEDKNWFMGQVRRAWCKFRSWLPETYLLRETYACYPKSPGPWIHSGVPEWSRFKMIKNSKYSNIGTLLFLVESFTVVWVLAC